MVRVSAENTKLQAEVYEEEVKSKIESAKENVSQKISSLKTEAYSIARHLPSSEVEALLSELVWILHGTVAKRQKLSLQQAIIRIKCLRFQII